MTASEETELRDLLDVYESALGRGVAQEMRSLRTTLASVASQRDRWMSEAARHKAEIKALRKRLGE